MNAYRMAKEDCVLILLAVSTRKLNRISVYCVTPSPQDINYPQDVRYGMQNTANLIRINWCALYEVCMNEFFFDSH